MGFCELWWVVGSGSRYGLRVQCFGRSAHPGRTRHSCAPHMANDSCTEAADRHAGCNSSLLLARGVSLFFITTARGWTKAPRVLRQGILGVQGKENPPPASTLAPLAGRRACMGAVVGGRPFAWRPHGVTQTSRCDTNLTVLHKPHNDKHVRGSNWRDRWRVLS